MKDKYQEKLDLVYDLIMLANQSKMAFKNLLNEAEVIPLENIENDPVYNTEPLSFHPNGKCGCVDMGDDYIFGIRCGHLIWFEGKCEYPDCEAIIVCGNHKGIYMQKLIVFHKR